MKTFLFSLAAVCLSLLLYLSMSNRINTSDSIPDIQDSSGLGINENCSNTGRTAYRLTVDRELSNMLISSTANIGKPVFLSLSDTNIFQVEMNYLGRIITDEACYKLLNVINFTGTSSRRADAGLYIYNAADEMLGRYYLGGIWGLPDAIEGQDLIFMSNEVCAETTKIDFSEGPPNEMFVPCNGEYGDFWSFNPADSLRH